MSAEVRRPGQMMCMSSGTPQGYPDDPEMQVSHETIYQSLFVQSRGALRKELHPCLRTGRAMRRAKAYTKGGNGQGQLTQHGDDLGAARRGGGPGRARATGKGDLHLRQEDDRRSAPWSSATAATSCSLKLPNGHGAEAVRKAMTKRIFTLPAQLRRSITWDQGKEMAEHVQFTVDTGVQVYFCDPQEPLAAREQREHQRIAPPVLPPQHRLPDAHPERARRRRR